MGPVFSSREETTTTLNIQLTCWPGGEESIHHWPRHLDHTEPQSPDISLHPEDQTCSQEYTVYTLSCLLEGRKDDNILCPFGMHVQGLCAHVQCVMLITS